MYITSKQAGSHIKNFAMEFNDNILTEGLSGKMGDLIYYQLHGKTCVRRAPGSYNKIPTDKQAIVRTRFLEAVRFAQEAISNPVVKADYLKRSKGKRSAYAQALSEFLSQ